MERCQHVERLIRCKNPAGPSGFCKGHHPNTMQSHQGHRPNQTYSPRCPQGKTAVEQAHE